MGKGFFITATGTGEGKTIFTAGLLIKLMEAGINAAPVKPVQTGAGKSKIAPDLALVFKLAGFKPAKGELDSMQPFIYKDACSPHLAAKREKRKAASIAGIIKAIKGLGEKYSFIIAEGAGGLFVPLSRKKNQRMIDLIKETGFKAVLVCPAGLGAINSACLSLYAMKKAGIKIAGFVLNDVIGDKREAYIIKDNAKTISAMTGAVYLGTLPYMNIISRQALSKVFDGLIGLKKLLKGIK